MKRVALFASVFTLCLSVASTCLAQTATSKPAERKPEFAFSIANAAPGVDRGKGPLFRRIRAAFLAANEGNGSKFSIFLADVATLQLLQNSAAGPKKSLFSVQAIRAATQSCVGPYPYDEGSNWVQLSWICRVDREAPLSNIVTFRDSPELTLTVWFDPDLFITEITAMEPLPIPGKRFVPMDGYARLKGAERG